MKYLNFKSINTKTWLKNFSLTFNSWLDDQAFTLSAALSYYMIFSIAPLILIAVAVSGLVWGPEASSGEIYDSISGLLGTEGAKSIQSFVEASSIRNAGVFATVVGVITLIIGSTSVFAQLQDSLNQIWKVKRKPGSSIADILRQRLLSFSLILIIAFLLLVSLLFSAILTAVGKLALVHLAGGEFIWHLMDIFISFSLTAFLFAAIYKILPDVKLEWKDVTWGATVTALFFTLGKILIGLYLGHAAIMSTFGAAGSLALLLVWTYYSAMVLFFGAEITKFHAGKHELSLKEGAQWIDSNANRNPSAPQMV